MKNSPFKESVVHSILLEEESVKQEFGLCSISYMICHHIYLLLKDIILQTTCLGLSQFLTINYLLLIVLSGLLEIIMMILGSMLELMLVQVHSYPHTDGDLSCGLITANNTLMKEQLLPNNPVGTSSVNSDKVFQMKL